MPALCITDKQHLEIACCFVIAVMYICSHKWFISVETVMSIYVSQGIHGKDSLINYQSMGSCLLAWHTVKEHWGSIQSWCKSCLWTVEVFPFHGTHKVLDFRMCILALIPVLWCWKPVFTQNPFLTNTVQGHQKQCASRIACWYCWEKQARGWLLVLLHRSDLTCSSTEFNGEPAGASRLNREKLHLHVVWWHFD
jgi:hypothetical protein